MDKLKKYAKYVLWVVGFYILTSFLIFVGFNANYRPMQLREKTSEIISIDKAEANKIQGRVYGYIYNTEQNELNGKYIKISVYNSNNENIVTEYLKIENIDSSSKKLFKSNFKAKDAKSYEVNIVNNKD